MKTITLTQVQRLLLGIIASVEGDITSPEDAVTELEQLKQTAKEAGLKFAADYKLEDFERIRAAYVSEYESSAPFETSESTY